MAVISELSAAPLQAKQAVSVEMHATGGAFDYFETSKPAATQPLMPAFMTRTSV